MQCRYHVGQLGRLYPQFQSAGSDVVVILGSGIEQARAYAESLHTPFPVLADPDRKVYAKFGLDKAIGIIQRTASVIVDRHGIVRYIKRAANPMTWLQENKELVDTVKSIG